MNTGDSIPLPAEELDRFLLALIHELRNRLNLISLEAANLAEEAEGKADATRLQQHIADYSAFLKKLHRQASHEDAPQTPPTLAELTRQIKAKE
jgi:signal transduction histidine kinase